MHCSRRQFFGVIAAVPWLGSCGSQEASPLSSRWEKLSLRPVANSDLLLLSDPRALAARGGQGGGGKEAVLEIRGKIFGGSGGNFSGTSLVGIRFVDCLFDAFQGLDNNLENVVFDNCRFRAATLNGSHWINVTFQKCEMLGHFCLEGAFGNVRFESCRFSGFPGEEGGDWSEHFGYAAVRTGITSFSHCDIRYLSSGGATGLQLLDCDVQEFRAECHSRGGTLHLENCRAPAGRMDFCDGVSSFTSVSLVNSRIAKLQLGSVRIADFAASHCLLDVELGGVRGWVGEAAVRHTAFAGRGFRCPASSIDSLLFEDCVFASGSSLQLFGKASRFVKPGDQLVLWGRGGSLVLRRTSVAKARLTHLQIGVLIVAESSLSDADLSWSRIGTVRLQDVALNGILDLTETTICRLESSGVSNSAQMVGRLTASVNAPEPDVDVFPNLVRSVPWADASKRMPKKKPGHRD